MKKLKQLLNRNHTILILGLMIIIFLFYAVFIAFTLKPGIIPDEERTFAVSKHFSTTPGIPPDVSETLALNAIIKQNPNLYYWINGRIINLVNLFYPTASDWQLLISLRLVNVLYCLGTIIFCYLFSKELISHKWWQLLPVFLLTNTIMFVFLAGGVNDDNLVHLAGIAALYFMMRIFNHHNFMINSTAMLICLAASTLIKHRVFPFVFAVGMAWIIYIIRNYKTIAPLKLRGWKTIILGIIFLSLIIGNLSIYGYNLVVYRSFLPACKKILTKEQCDLRLVYYETLGPEYTQAFKLGEDYRLTISESIDLGYPGPLRYIFNYYIPNLFSRLFGICATPSYYSVPMTFAHVFLLYWFILITAVYWRDLDIKLISLLGILLFYFLILTITIYREELLRRFNLHLIQGRYIFLVINIAFVFAAKVIQEIPWKMIRIPTLILMLLLYFFSGPFSFILKFNTVFSDWLVI